MSSSMFKNAGANSKERRAVAWTSPPSCTACSFNPPWRFQYVVAYAKKYGLNNYHTQLANLLIAHYKQFHILPAKTV